MSERNRIQAKSSRSAYFNRLYYENIDTADDMMDGSIYNIMRQKSYEFNDT